MRLSLSVFLLVCSITAFAAELKDSRAKRASFDRTWNYEISIKNNLMEPVTFRFNGTRIKSYYIEPKSIKKINITEKSVQYFRSVVSYHEILDVGLNTICDTQLSHIRGRHSSTSLTYLSAPKKTCKLKHSEGMVFYTSQHIDYELDEKGE